MTITPQRSRFAHYAAIAGLSALLGLLALAMEKRELLHTLDLSAYDLLVAFQSYEPPSDQIINIDFDESTVRKYNAFPLPRLLLAQVIAKIASTKPAVIGVDVILDIKRDPDDDAKLAKAIDDAGNVILISEYGFGSHPRNDPLPDFQKAAAGVAFGDLPIDEDGAIRRMFLRVTTNDYKSLSFPVALADLASDQHLRPNGENYLLFGQHKLPLATTHPDPDSALIHFHPSAPTQVISVEDLLAQDFNPPSFANKVILIGQSSEMGKDLFRTPVPRRKLSINCRDTSKDCRDILSGAEIHAAAVASLLNHNVLSTLPITPRILAAIVLAFIIITLALRHRWHIALVTCLVFAVAVFLVAAFLLSSRHLWVPLVSVELCLLAALPTGLGYRSVEERRLKLAMEAERQQLMGIFERYVSADVAAEIWKNRDRIVLEGEERVVTVIFSDIRSFTATTAGVPSQEVLAWLNRYLTVMSEVIKQNRGYLNKYIGDGIMVVFGAPLSEGVGEDARRAVRCAVEMLARVDEWNANKAPGDPPLKIGIGIHTGQVTAGNVGSPDRLEYSVIGETVNLASRLEALTKEAHSPVVFSPATYEHVREAFSVVSLGEYPVRGFTQAVPLYGVKPPTPMETEAPQ
jgi:adenylate cyclase